MSRQPKPHRWTNKSVLAMAGTMDPVESVTALARDLATKALDRGWAGPPFDPISLASLVGIDVVANSDVRDARTVAAARNELRIEFNPSRPRGRVRFSIAHEIAHTLFADCGEKVRNRGHHAELAKDEWQLEALCNIAAAELLMPFGEMRSADGGSLDIHRVLELQRRFDVSTEVVTIRLAETSDAPLAAFCASVRPGGHHDRLRLDYVIPSRGWPSDLALNSVRIPDSSAAHQCVAVGYSASGVESWTDGSDRLRVDAVGIPPYPGGERPRVVGLIQPTSPAATIVSTMSYVFGDATQPRGEGKRVIVQVVNDKTPNWGGAGFASAIRREFPSVQEAFKQWATEPRALRLGGVHQYEAAPGIFVMSIVAQRGYGPSPSPRLRYQALQSGLRVAADFASRAGANVHMPRIGTGHAGGDWSLIEELIREEFGKRQVSVTVYDPPGSTPVQKMQTAFQFVGESSTRLARR